MKPLFYYFLLHIHTAEEKFLFILLLTNFITNAFRQHLQVRSNFQSVRGSGRVRGGGRGWCGMGTRWPGRGSPAVASPEPQASRETPGGAGCRSPARSVGGEGRVRAGTEGDGECRQVSLVRILS